MDNLISVFMNYKIDRLTEYGVFAYQEDSEFIRYVFHQYFGVYVDNYYYNIFQTIEEETSYSDENLKLEFKGIMEEMLDDYREYELQVSNEEYSHNQKVIRELNPICYALVKIDWLKFDNKDEIPAKVGDFIGQNEFLQKLVGEREVQLSRLVRNTYQTYLKLLEFTDTYYGLKKRMFEENKKDIYWELVPKIKTLGNYRKSMVQKVYEDERLEQEKLECIIQKISLEILKSTLKEEEIPLMFIEFGGSAIARGKIKDEIIELIDNPLFRKYVVLAVNYSVYANQKSAFVEDYQFACIQDFTHINDIYLKVENISKEGIFHYLIVSDYRYKDRDFYTGYENDAMKILLFEEE